MWACLLVVEIDEFQNNTNSLQEGLWYKVRKEGLPKDCLRVSVECEDPALDTWVDAAVLVRL